jgi:glycosyltransferase domain-containing protein
MNANSILSKLTLVIPTYNRQQYAVRNMQYWSGRGITLHVVDGSSQPIRENIINSFSENIFYHHLPIPLVDRLSFIMENLQTEYTSWCGDDEFYIASALEESINELDSNSDLVAVCGRSLGFYHKDSSVYGELVYPLMENYKLLQDNPFDRMITHFRNYTQTALYAVVRTNVWQQSFKAYTEHEFPLYAIGEYQFEMAVSYFGKSKVIPTLMWLRSQETTPIRGTDPSLNPKNRVHEWWLNPENGTMKEDFVQTMAETLDVGEQSNINKIKEAIKKSLDAYVEFSLDYFGERKGNFIWNTIRGFIRRIKLCNEMLFNSSNSMNEASDIQLSEVAQKLSQTGVSIDYKELKNIEKKVLDFHEHRIRNYGL